MALLTPRCKLIVLPSHNVYSRCKYEVEGKYSGTEAMMKDARHRHTDRVLLLLLQLQVITALEISVTTLSSVRRTTAWVWSVSTAELSMSTAASSVTVCRPARQVYKFVKISTSSSHWPSISWEQEKKRKWNVTSRSQYDLKPLHLSYPRLLLQSWQSLRLKFMWCLEHDSALLYNVTFDVQSYLNLSFVV